MVEAFDRATGLLDRVRDDRDELRAPLRIRLHAGPFLDARTYRLTAERNLAAFRELGGLEPGSAVLDIGCGSGRLAAAFARYLVPPGRYEGFDPAPGPVAWCQAHITPRAPHVRFTCADVRSLRYHPEGSVSPVAYRFPYPDASFDLVTAASVYTHMLPDEIVRYVTETARVLRPGGRSVSTFCLWNAANRDQLERGATDPALPHAWGESFVRDLRDPAAFIAQPESLVRVLLAKAGLRLVEPIRFGGWSRGPVRAEERSPFGFSQDVVVASKGQDREAAVRDTTDVRPRR
jgi:SAM-dependent methyltransferase